MRVSVSTTILRKVLSIECRLEKQLIAKMNSKLRQNYHQDCEEAINKQINMELNASYAYMSMVSHVTFSIKLLRRN